MLSKLLSFMFSLSFYRMVDQTFAVAFLKWDDFLESALCLPTRLNYRCDIVGESPLLDSCLQGLFNRCPSRLALNSNVKKKLFDSSISLSLSTVYSCVVEESLFPRV